MNGLDKNGFDSFYAFSWTDSSFYYYFSQRHLESASHKCVGPLLLALALLPLLQFLSVEIPVAKSRASQRLVRLYDLFRGLDEFLAYRRVSDHLLLIRMRLLRGLMHWADNSSMN